MGLIQILLAFTTCFALANAGKRIIPTDCVFPFIYKGKTYNECVDVNANKPWCSTDKDYVGKWRYCEEEKPDPFDTIFQKLKDYQTKIAELEKLAKSDKTCRCQKELTIIAKNQAKTRFVIKDHERRLKKCDEVGPMVTIIDARVTKIEVVMPQITQVIKIVKHKVVRPKTPRPKPVTRPPLPSNEKCGHHGGRAYIFALHRMNWNAALNYCRSRYGGKLAEPRNHRDNNYMAKTAMRYSRTKWWFGVNDMRREGHYVYTNGSPAHFRHWRRGEPNNLGNEDCIHFGWDTNNPAGWNDENCRGAKYFICEANRNRC